MEKFVLKPLVKKHKYSATDSHAEQSYREIENQSLEEHVDLKQSEVTEAKSSIEEPPKLELKDLPSHLEYAYLEENDKLPVIIAKGLKNHEKDALLKVVKSHKRAIAWKITDIMGIDPRLQNLDGG
ncbi:hypothetical protein Tco_0060929 [Tanacetum coccineum]